MALALRLVVTAVAVWLAVAFVDGLDFDGNWVALLIIAAVLAALNMFVKPVVKLLSLPFVILTLGLFLLVINAVLLAVVLAISDAANLGLTSDGFGATFVGAIVISIVTWVGELVTGYED